METKLGQYVVVGVDGSDSALRAVRWAADEAARRGAPLRLVTAFGWTDDISVGYPGLNTLPRRPAGPVPPGPGDGGRDRRGATARVELSHELRIGQPIGTMADEARRAQLLVVGDRGLNRVEGLLVGSVGVAMATHAECPVVVVRGPETNGRRPAGSGGRRWHCGQ